MYMLTKDFGDVFWSSREKAKKLNAVVLKIKKWFKGKGYNIQYVQYHYFYG